MLHLSFPSSLCSSDLNAGGVVARGAVLLLLRRAERLHARGPELLNLLDHALAFGRHRIDVYVEAVADLRRVHDEQLALVGRLEGVFERHFHRLSPHLLSLLVRSPLPTRAAIPPFSRKRT